MARERDKTKTKWIILTFLLCNKGKKFTTSQMSDFLIENKLNRKNSELKSSAIARMINSDIQFGTILRDVKVEKVRGRNYYWMEA